jgi:hypothetical protein
MLLIWMTQGKGILKGLSIFIGQGDYWRNDRIVRIDVVLSIGVDKPLLD